MADQIFLSPVHRALVLPHRADVAALIPAAKEFIYEGLRRLVVPHTIDSTRLLRNLDLNIPSPILSNYDWNNSKPWEVQKQTAAMLTTSPRAYVLNQMRTGKTLSTLWARDFLAKYGEVRRTLIIAPLSTLNVVWGSELFRHFPGVTFKVLHGTKQRRLQRLAEPADVYIINHDGVEVIAKELGERTDIDCVIIDEIAAYREARTKRWATVAALVKDKRFVWGLTGAPTPNAPTDAYGIAKLLRPESVPKYFKEFRDRTMLKVSQFRYVAKADAMDVVYNTLKPSVRFTRKDVGEAPPTMFLDRECVLSDQARQLMKMLIDKLRLARAEGTLTAVNAGVLLNKVLQIATGAVYLDGGRVLEIPSPSRLSALCELLAETDRKALVFAPYVHVVEGVTKHLRDAGWDVAMVYGDTPTRERDDIFRQFQQTPRYDVMVAHPQCMAHGLTLTAADVAIWYGPPPSNEIYAQANDRIALPGLDYQTAIYHLIGCPQEKRRYAGLRKMETAQQTLLGMLEGVHEDY